MSRTPMTGANTLSSWILRALLVVVSLFLSAWSIRMAIADLRTQHNGMNGLNAAIRLEPNDSVLVARAALFLNSNGDTSPEVGRQLRRAAELDPLNSDVQIALGLREEFLGHPAEAGRWLVRAAEIDHTFKPAWALANFYVRNGQPGKSWPLLQRILNLNPLAFDPAPVFDLCWNLTGDQNRILALIPPRGAIPLQYLYYLVRTRRIDEAIAAWPRVLAAADSNNPPSLPDMVPFTDVLEQANRVPEAVRVWNQLRDRRIVVSGKLDPAAGISIADPDFRFPFLEKGFGWRITRETGVAVSRAASALRFEFDGNEPEALTLLTAPVPLIPGRSYRVVWKTDASDLSSHQAPGFAFQIVQRPGDTVTACPPLLKMGDDGVCPFASLPDAGGAHLDLLYKRALGTTRVQGTLRIVSVKLELAS